MSSMKKRIKWLSWIALASFLTLTAGCAAAPPRVSGAASNPNASVPFVPPQATQAPSGVFGAPSVAREPNGYDGNADYYGEDTYYARGGESYSHIDANGVMEVARDPLLTFSLKVDSAAYANVARYINSGSLPPDDAVRTEELINYFPYEMPPAFSDGPFSVYAEIGPSPLDAAKRMAFIRVKTHEIDRETLPPCNLTFLIDSSGSMDSYDKLPLLKEAFGLLVETLGPGDTVSIVTYAGSSAVILDSVRGDDREHILAALDRLSAGGSTAGEGGIQTAYALAEKNFIEGGNNRIILATDGDFNVGTSDVGALSQLVAEKKETGIYLSVLGFGTGNIRDDIMESLAQHGSGNYAYIHSVAEARKVLVDELASNLYTLADDVKAQLEFNPYHVAGYRLIGYENRMLDDRDFEDDAKDAGEIGVGTDVVLMVELELTDARATPALKYGDPAVTSGAEAYAGEYLEVRIRYKEPGTEFSRLIAYPVLEAYASEDQVSDDFVFACSVAAFGELLRGSQYARGIAVDDVIRWAEGSLGEDAERYRAQHVDLLRQYRMIAGR